MSAWFRLRPCRWRLPRDWRRSRPKAPRERLDEMARRLNADPAEITPQEVRRLVRFVLTLRDED